MEALYTAVVFHLTRRFHRAFLPIDGIPDGMAVKAAVHTAADSAVFQRDHFDTAYTASFAHTAGSCAVRNLQADNLDRTQTRNMDHGACLLYTSSYIRQYAFGVGKVMNARIYLSLIHI